MADIINGRVEVQPDASTEPTLEQSNAQLEKAGVVNTNTNTNSIVATTEADKVNETLETPEQRPEWLPEKFSNAQELAKAYGELEKQFSQKQQETPKDEPNMRDAREAAEQSQALDRFYGEYAEAGELSDKSYNDLEKMGLSRDVVDGYIAGQKAIADNDVAEVQNAVGGADNYTKIIEWSQQNLSQGEQDAFNQIVENGTKDQIKIAVQGLQSRAGMNVGVQQDLFEGDTSLASNEVFESVAQVTDAMNDRRYETDPAYRKSVTDKLARSNVL